MIFHRIHLPTWLFFFLACQLPVSAQLKWDQTEQVFQATLNDAFALADYTFINAGAQTVSVLKIESSCGCTTVQADKKQYAPGEKGKVTARFTFERRSGPQTKEFLVKTDGTPSLTILRLKGSIPAPFTYEPKSLIWTKEEANIPKTIRLTPHPEAGNLVPVITPNTAFYTASLTPSQPSGLFEIKIEPKTPRTSTRTLIQVETGHPRQKTISIPIHYQ